MKCFLFLAAVILLSCNEKTPDKVADVSSPNLDISKGENLFKANCANCHKPNEKLLGPALQGVVARWESKTLLYEFIKNSQDVISRNAYAKQLVEEYKQSPMQPFPILKDEEIASILAYCDLPVQ
jgi:mono/diheme cytochrome c family protein